MDGIEIEMHSKDDCIYCDKAKAWLNERGIVYVETKHNDPAERQKLYDSLSLVGSKRSVPQMFILDRSSDDRFHLGGFAELEESGLG